jgi:hypothetical protein
MLGRHVGAAADDLVYVTNPRTALNEVACCLSLDRCDRVLGAARESGAMNRDLHFVPGWRRARHVRQAARPRIHTPEQVVEAMWSGGA